MGNNNIWTYEEISAPHLMFMRLIAVLPLEGKSLNDIGTRFLGAHVHISNIVFNILWCLYGIEMFKRKSIEVDYVCELIVVENSCIHYLVIFFKREHLMKIIELCKELWIHITPNESKIIRIYERKAYYFRLISLITTYVSIAIFIVTAQIVKVQPTNANGTATKSLPFRFFMEVHEEPLLSLVGFLQTYLIVTSSTTLTIINTIGLYLVMMACGYLKSLRNQLNSLSEIRDDKEEKNCKKYEYSTKELALKNARACAQFHQKIMLLCEELESFLRSLNFITISTTVYNMSILGFKIFKESGESVKYISLFNINLFEFFICQWSPEYLFEESSAVANAAYFATMKQSDYQDEICKILCFMIFRAQKPIQLTAAGYIKLSMETFAAMIKTVFSFFAFLCTFTKN